MKAAIITIGDEILIGQTVDTNSAWIGSELSKSGFDVFVIKGATICYYCYLLQLPPENDTQLALFTTFHK